MVDPNPVAAARAWIAQDPDPQTRAELEGLISAGDTAELAERMVGPLQFGTAGLRGLVGAGIARMNRAVVIRATRGLADTLRARVPDHKSLPVIVGYDGRLTSEAFAEETIAVLLGAGVPVRRFTEPVPTPLVAYAARELSAQAAVVITASHNPPQYNGYKVYAPNAVQIVPPWDTEIASRIEAIVDATQVKRAPDPLAHAEPVPSTLFERYLDELDAIRPAGAADRNFGIVYTPMHGVGWKFVQRALARAGYADVAVVPEQAEPDGRFPTVNFPNPEEPGALDLAMTLAAERGAELVIANDPDADRLAVCARTPSGRYVQLTGNQVGVLLGDFMLASALRAPQPAVLSSIVSSPMLGAIAQKYGAHFEQTLTGFKWIWNAALDLERDRGLRFAFGYEEALGYSVGRLVRDKDGVSAAVLFADLAAQCRAQDKSVLDRLAELYREHGLWVSVQKSITRPGSEGLAEIARAVDRIGAEPPAEVCGHEVSAVTDYRRGGESRARWMPNTEMIGLDLEGGGRILVRPSGTEPKLKIYVDLRGDVGADQSVQAVEALAQEKAREMSEAVARAAGL